MGKKNIQILAWALKAGKTLILPSKTCYMACANAANAFAVDKIYALKGREDKKPLTIMVADLKMAKEYAQVTPAAEKAIKKFMPKGSLSICLKKKKGRLAENLCEDTIVLRTADDLFLKKLIAALGRPITATSANQSGQQPAYSISEQKEFMQKADFVVDGGKMPKRAPTSIIDFSGKKVRLIREGSLSFGKVLKEVGE
ncbi:threonylcarbamoyl-AMP synthase [Candidatus Micrarchaeota archaeon]|nr:threonylcarbamoyl-AMP synthase [Candidatus Micrarchaeota archaeon]